MRARIRTGLPAVALVAVLVVSGCGSDDGADATDERTTEETTTDGDSENEDTENEDTDDTEPSEDEEGDPAPGPGGTPEAPDGDAEENGSTEGPTVAEAVEHMQGVWESERSETRLLAVDGAAVVLMDDGTACTGGHDEGPVPITLAVYCDDDPPQVANVTGEGENLTLDWVGEESETYTLIADSIDDLN